MNNASLFLPMLSLIFVLALVILGYMYINKKKRAFHGKSGITEFTRHYLTAKSYVSIVKIGDKFFSLGVSEHNVNKLSELTEDEAIKYFSQENNLEIVNDFSELFKNAKKKLKNRNMRDENNEKGE